MKKVFGIWIFTTLVASCLLGTIYFVVQQNMRSSANDPQIQIAEDTAVALNRHEYMNLPQHAIDISQSLSPFLMIFDTNGTVKSSQAVLNNLSPIVPSGVFSYATRRGEDRFTWQPQANVRLAAVVVKYDNGFILSGRNIREVEKREDNLLYQIEIGWIATVFVSLLASLVFLTKKK